MYSIARIVQLAFNFYNGLILVYCILSWFPRSGNMIVNDRRYALDVLVGRFLSVFRGFIPPIAGMDFSPIIAILALSFVERLLLNILL